MSHPPLSPQRPRSDRNRRACARAACASLVALVLSVAGPARAAWVVPSVGSHHSRNTCIDLFDEDSGTFVGELRCEIPWPDALAISPDGDVLVAGSGSGSTTLLRIDGLSGERTLLSSGSVLGEIEGLAFTPEGDLLASSATMHRVFRLNAMTGAVLDTPVFGAALAGATSVAFDAAGDLYVADESHGRLFRFDGGTGEWRASVTWAPVIPRGMAFGADGMLYVASRLDDAVLRVDPATGVTLSVFASGNGLDNPEGVTFGPDGHLYVASSGTDQVLRYDGVSGAFLSVFAASAQLSSPSGITFGPDGHLYVANLGHPQIIRFDGTTGAPMGVFAQWISGFHRALAFAPNGDLLASGDSGTQRQLRRYDGTTGATEGFGISSAGDGLAFGPDGLAYLARGDRVFRYDASVSYGTTPLGPWVGSPEPEAPEALRYGPDGALYIVSSATDRVYRFDLATGTSSVFAEGGGADGITDLRFGPGGDLYVTSENTDEVLRYDGLDGTPLGPFAAGGGLQAPRSLHFGNDGDLYVHGLGVGILRFDGANGAPLGTFAFPAPDFQAAQLETSPVQDALPGVVPRIDVTGDGASPLIDPTDAAVGPDDSIYVVGRLSENVFRIDADGTITEVLDASGGNSGVPLSAPFRVAVGGDGTVAIANANDFVHRISPGGQVDVVLNESTPHWDGARDVAVDDDGNVYAAGVPSVLFKIPPSGPPVQALRYQGDGQGNLFDGPTALAVDRFGTVYAGAATSNNVFKITASGGVSEIFDGDSVSVRTYGVTDVAVAGTGHVFVGAKGSIGRSVIYRIAPGLGPEFWESTSIPLTAMAADHSGALVYAMTRGLYRHMTPTRVTTPLDDLVGPLGLVLGGALDFEFDAYGDLVVPSLLANAVYRLDVPPGCSDGIDNDGDGLIDYPADPGCRSEDYWTEAPQCDDDVDNDGDGKIDFAGGPSGEPPDPTCKHAWEIKERQGCGLGFELVAVLLPIAWLRRARRRAREG